MSYMNYMNNEMGVTNDLIQSDFPELLESIDDQVMREQVKIKVSTNKSIDTKSKKNFVYAV